MTTIACDGKSMAGDSQITGGNQVVGFHHKVHRAKDGRIYGVCGCSMTGIRFGRWMNGEDEKPDLEEDFEALILNLDGTIQWINQKLEPLTYLAPMSLGSGEGIALGAMLAGADAERAVALAAERDTKTGGAITVVHLEQGSKAPLTAVR